jgi:Flp pilus assembly protein TadG
MSSKRNQFVRDTRGQSLVEFALILPMMLVVMFMITEFGRALYMYNVLSSAARAGARMAVVSGSANAVANGTTAVQKLLASANMDTGASINVAIDSNYNGTGVKVVTATVSRPFTWAFNGPLPVNAGANPATVSKKGLTLTGQAIMKAETF